MGRFSGIFITFNKLLSIVAGTALSLMMLLTVADVIMRAGGRPILGTYEVVSFLLAIVIGFSLPKVSLDRGHVYMEIILNIVSKRTKAIFNTFTRILCIILFAVIGYNLFLVGNEYRLAGEVSSTLRLPFYYVAYCVGVCSFFECMVLIYDIVRVWRGEYE